jgi:pyochelin biosynthetic protein PchC
VAAEPDLLSLLLPALRADIAAIETYSPQRREPLDCPILAIGGADDRLTPRSHLEEWHVQTRHDLRVRIFPGGHFYLEQCRDAVLAEICSTLSLPLRSKGAFSDSDFRMEPAAAPPVRTSAATW